MRKHSRFQRGVLVGGIAAFLLCASGTAIGGGYMLSAVGDRARSMGGAFTGLADDWSASYYNPAGAAFIKQSEFYMGGVAITPRMNFTPIQLRGVDVPDGEYYNVDQTYVMPSGGGYAKLPDAYGISLGLGVYTPVDNNIKWNLFNPDYPTSVAFPDRDTESDINVWNFQPTIGWEVVPDRFALGIGMSLQYSEMLNHRVQPVFLPDLEVLGIPPYPSGIMLSDTYLIGDGWGFGYNIGALAKGDMLSFGVSYRGESVIKYSGTAEARLWSQEGRPDLGYESSPLLEQDLYGGKVHRAVQDADFELTIPPTLSAGVAYTPNERLTLTGDVAYTWYSQVSGIPVTNQDYIIFKLGGSTNQLWLPVFLSDHYEWKDQYRVSAGVEYLASERLTLRGGMFFEPSPIRTSSLSPLYTDIGDKISPSMGVSYDVGKYTFSYGYGVVFYGSRTAELWSDSSIPGEYNNVQHESFFSLRYRW